MNGQHPSRNAGSSYAVPLYDTTELVSTLANPYARHVSTHYQQAYLRAYHRPHTTTDGYTLSSTYVPGTSSQTNRAAPTLTAPPRRDQHSAQAQLQSTAKPIRNHFTYGSWYQPGNTRCTRQGCPFTGSRKSVEIHMMDRHFIFPPGWRKKDDWDADPSLKGKQIPIQGTSLMLDTPEAIDAWIAERKRRFPTEERIQDKKRKFDDAVAQGQLIPEDMDVGARKRYRQNKTFVEGENNGTRGKGYQRGRGHRRGGLAQREEPQPKIVDNSTSRQADAERGCTREATPNSASTADDDEAPEIVSSKAPTSPPCVPNGDRSYGGQVQKSLGYTRRRALRPKEPPRNPFASRSTLLRNLLLPEIRITISNLSQAVRFLVENDFLRGVELRPGEGQEQMIEVLGSSEIPGPVHHPSPDAPKDGLQALFKE